MVETTFHFPQYPSGKKFPIGVPVTVLCHLKNDGKLPVNITSIMGSLNADKRFYDYLQNFTAAPFSTVVKPAEEITLSYKFVLNKDLEPEKYQLAHTGDDFLQSTLSYHICLWSVQVSTYS